VSGGAQEGRIWIIGGLLLKWEAGLLSSSESKTDLPKSRSPECGHSEWIVGHLETDAVRKLWGNALQDGALS